jgi:hypothetical protein
MIAELPSVSVVLEVIIGGQHHVALMRAVNNNDSTFVEVLTFVKKVHDFPLQGRPLEKVWTLGQANAILRRRRYSAGGC